MKMFNIQFVGQNSDQLGYWIAEAESKYSGVPFPYWRLLLIRVP